MHLLVNPLCTYILTIDVTCTDQGGKASGTDQTKQIEELRMKLAVAEKKAADYG